MEEIMCDDIYEALNMMISNSRRTFKEVAYHLFPNIKPDSAYANLKNCLKREGLNKLDPEQILELMRYCDSYEFLYYLCQETFHEIPNRLPIEDQKIKADEEIRRAQEIIKKNEAFLRKLDSVDNNVVRKIA